MGSGIAMAGLAQGLAQGLKLGSDLQDAEERRTALREQGERDKVRFDFEKKQMAEKEGQIKAREEFAQTMASITDDAVNGRNGFEQYGFAAPQPQQQGAIAAPGAQPAAAPASNPFKTTADGLYRNQRGADQLISERRAAALENLYAKLGEPEKAAMVRSQMADLFDKDVERKVKTALVGAALGAPGSLDALSKAYSYLNDGQTIDAKSAQWDANTKTWKGVTFLDGDGKPVGTKDLTQTDLLGMAKRDASAIAMFNIEQGWKEKEYGLKERSTRADEKRADAAVVSANADMAYKGKYGEYLDRKGKEEADASKQKAGVEAVARMFPNAHKDYKPEELMLEKDKGKAKIDLRDQEKAMFDKTLDLKALNPNTNLHVLGQVARNGWAKKLNAQPDADGRMFTMVGKEKVYLQ